MVVSFLLCLVFSGCPPFLVLDSSTCYKAVVCSSMGSEQCLSVVFVCAMDNGAMDNGQLAGHSACCLGLLFVRGSAHWSMEKAQQQGLLPHDTGDCLPPPRTVLRGTVFLGGGGCWLFSSANDILFR